MGLVLYTIFNWCRDSFFFELISALLFHFIDCWFQGNPSLGRRADVESLRSCHSQLNCGKGNIHVKWARVSVLPVRWINYKIVYEYTRKMKQLILFGSLTSDQYKLDLLIIKLASYFMKLWINLYARACKGKVKFIVSKEFWWLWILH